MFELINRTLWSTKFHQPQSFDDVSFFDVFFERRSEDTLVLIAGSFGETDVVIFQVEMSPCSSASFGRLRTGVSSLQFDQRQSFDDISFFDVFFDDLGDVGRLDLTV